MKEQKQRKEHEKLTKAEEEAQKTYQKNGEDTRKIQENSKADEMPRKEKKKKTEQRMKIKRGKRDEMSGGCARENQGKLTR